MPCCHGDFCARARCVSSVASVHSPPFTLGSLRALRAAVKRRLTRRFGGDGCRGASCSCSWWMRGARARARAGKFLPLVRFTLVRATGATANRSSASARERESVYCVYCSERTRTTWWRFDFNPFDSDFICLLLSARMIWDTAGNCYSKKR